MPENAMLMVETMEMTPASGAQRQAARTTGQTRAPRTVWKV